jgi:hypothetical protein
LPSEHTTEGKRTRRAPALNGLASCGSCGFEACGAIGKLTGPTRQTPDAKPTGPRVTTLLCEPCAAQLHGAKVDACEWIWAPETSQAAIANLVRTAHVILHLHRTDGIPAARPIQKGSADPEDLDLDFSSFDTDLGGSPFTLEAGDEAPPMVVGATRILKSWVPARSVVLELLRHDARRRSFVRTKTRHPDQDGGAERRLAAGIRVVPAYVSAEEVERWIEEGGTFAGWTAETLAAQIS